MTDKYALLVGTSEYDDTRISRLETPEPDVNMLARLLEDPKIGGFQVKLLLNQAFPQILRELVSFLKNRNKDDLLLVYFSGHGIVDETGRLFLAAKDTDKDLLSATSLSSVQLKDEMDRSRSKRQLLILDCCHSGAFQRGSKGDAPALTQDTFLGYGRAVFTASDSVQYAFEGNQVMDGSQLSLFTHFLAEGLETGEADAGGDGLVELDEWFDYAYRRVRDVTDKQTPRKFVNDQYGELYIAHSARPVKPAELPEKLRARLRSDWKPDRLDAIQELSSLLGSTDNSQVLAARQALEDIADRDDSLSVRNAAEAVLGLPPQTDKQPDRGFATIPLPGKARNPSTPGSLALRSDSTPRPLNNFPAFLLRHSLTLALALLASVLIMDLSIFKYSDYVEFLGLVGKQWVAAFILLIASYLFRKFENVVATWKMLGYGFILGSVLQGLIFMILELWGNGWEIQSGNWSPVVNGLTLACGIAIVQTFSHSAESRLVLALWTVAVTTAGGLIGVLCISFFDGEFVTVVLLSIIWGLLFGLVDGIALQWLEWRGQKTVVSAISKHS
jgi:hypothetical protein